MHQLASERELSTDEHGLAQIIEMICIGAALGADAAFVELVMRQATSR